MQDIKKPDVTSIRQNYEKTVNRVIYRVEYTFRGSFPAITIFKTISYMHAYCPECYQKVDEAGMVLPLYQLICDIYCNCGVPVALSERHWKGSLHYLEINDYIITSEATEDMIFAKPRIVALDDAETFICCSGNCEFSEIDFNAGDG